MDTNPVYFMSVMELDKPCVDPLPVIAHMAPKVGAGSLKLHPFGMSAPPWSGVKRPAQNC